MKISVIAGCIIPALLSCNRSSPAAPEKHYSFTGKVVSVSPADKTAAIAGSAIPNYMDAMTMDYPIKEKEDLQKLHPGDLITATVNVGDAGAYNLTGIQVTGHAAPEKK